MDLAEIVIKVDTRDLKSANDELGDLAKKGGKAAKEGVDPVGKSAANAASKVKLLVGGLIALTSGTVLKAAISASKEFSASLSNLSAITGATGDDLEYLKQQAMEIGRTTTLSASEAATAFKLIASAKPDLLESGEALNAVTRSAVTLAEAASIDLPTAAQALGKSLNQFGAGAEEANRFINVLAAGSKFGAAGIAEVSESLKNVGAVASGVGLSIEQTTTAIELLAAGGLSGAEAGTALRGVLLKLEKEGNANFQPAIVGLGTALQNLRDAGMSSTDMLDMFGMEGINAANILIANADSADNLQKALTGTSTALEQAATNTDNLAGDQLALNSAMEASAIALGQKLEPAIRSLTQLATAAFGLLATNIDTVTEGLTVLGIAMGVYFGYQGAALIIANIGKIRTALLTMNATLLANPIAAVVAAVAAGSYVMIKHWDKVKKFAERASIAINIAWNKLKLWFIKSFGGMLNTLMDTFDDLKNKAQATAYATKMAALDPLNAYETFNSTFDRTIGYLQAGKTESDIFADSAEATRSKIVELESALADTFTELDTGTTEKLPDAITALEDLANTATDTTIPEIKAVATASTETATTVTTATETMADKYKKTSEAISGFFTNLFTNGSNAFKDLATSFKNMLAQMVADFLASKLMGLLGSLLGRFGSIGQSIANILGVGGASGATAGAVAGGGGGGVAGAVAGGGAGAGAAGVAGGGAAVTTAVGQGGFVGTAAGGGGFGGVAGSTTAGGHYAGGSAGAAGGGAGAAGFANTAAGIGTLIFIGTGVAGRLTGKIPVFSQSGIVTIGNTQIPWQSSEFDQQNHLVYSPAIARQLATDGSRSQMQRAGDLKTYFSTSFATAQERAALLSEFGLSSNALDSIKGTPLNGVESINQQTEGLPSFMTSGYPSHKNGLDYVPYDGYIAELHRGERVMTADENRGRDNDVAMKLDQLIKMMGRSSSEANQQTSEIVRNTYETARQIRDAIVIGNKASVFN